MHYFAIVITAPGETIDQLMEPHREWYNQETDESGGIWDWYQLGGRWTGVLDKTYDPEEDRRNWDNEGRVKWPTQWTRHEGDSIPLAEYREVFSNHVPYTMISSGGIIQKEVWDGNDLIPTTDYEVQMRALMNACPEGSIAHVVDYHS